MLRRKRNVLKSTALGVGTGETPPATRLGLSNHSIVKHFYSQKIQDHPSMNSTLDSDLLLYPAGTFGLFDY